MIHGSLVQLLHCDKMYILDGERKNIEEIFIAKNILGNLFTVNVEVIGNVFSNIENSS